MLKALVLAACALAFAAAPTSSSAQSWPNRPIKMLVGFPPGGSTDLAARVLAAKLSQSLGQAVVVENRPGPAATSRRRRSRVPRPTATRC
jgi:tripartite-type tricarboxylate transporter receptor subunit TctC